MQLATGLSLVCGIMDSTLVACENAILTEERGLLSTIQVFFFSIHSHDNTFNYSLASLDSVSLLSIDCFFLEPLLLPACRRFSPLGRSHRINQKTISG